jgi:hypothetical protein
VKVGELEWNCMSKRSGAPDVGDMVSIPTLRGSTLTAQWSRVPGLVIDCRGVELQVMHGIRVFWIRRAAVELVNESR